MDAITWLREYSTFNGAKIYKNPLGPGWCCDLSVTGKDGSLMRSGTGATQAEAASLAAEAVAKELGWKNMSLKREKGKP